MLSQDNFELNRLTKDERKLAKSSVSTLKGIKITDCDSAQLIVNDQQVELPNAAVKLLCKALEQLAEGNGLTLTSQHKSLTTQEAADLLNVSRPFLIKLLESGQMPFSKVGNRRKVLMSDVLKYKRKKELEQQKAMDELIKQAQEKGMGYE